MPARTGMEGRSGMLGVGPGRLAESRAVGPKSWGAERCGDTLRSTVRPSSSVENTYPK